MRLFGLDVQVRRLLPLSPVMENRGGWARWLMEPFSGAWQRDVEWSVDSVLAHQAVYSCITLIAADFGKLRQKLVQQDADLIWTETSSAAFSPFLRRPNRYQNYIQFKEWWVTSKLIRGNAYGLIERDNRAVVKSVYLLDPARVQVLIAPDGSVFYQLAHDNLSGLQENSITVPASEIIHDRMNCLFHPLVGVSPIFASGMAANLGLKIQNNSATFFGKGSNPSGILTAPASIPEEKAKLLQERWTQGFSGANSGKVAVLGDGLKFEALSMSSVDSQLIQQLKWTADTVCSTFHVPAFKVGVGSMPTYQNAEILNQIYYSDCLQSHIESYEAVMDDALGLTTPVGGKQLGVELDLDALLRMDQATQVEVLGKAVGAGIMAPDEARQKLDLKPVPGGKSPYLQQQNYSLEDLARRSQKPDPFSTTPAAPPAIAPADEPKQLPPPAKEFDLGEVYIEFDRILTKQAA
jgi:HK97 family phage portal protein